MSGCDELDAALAKPVVPAINGLRAIAIFMLVGGHYARRSTDASVASLEMFAGYSIVLLFVLTGFIVTHVLIRELEGSAQSSLTSWYLSKALRIYPTLIAILLVTTGIEQFRNGFEVPVARYFGYLGLAGNYYYALAQADVNRHALGHLWSIMVGAHFLVPWVIVLRRATKKEGVDRLVAPLVGIIVLSGLLRVFLGDLTGASESYAYLSTETRVGEIALGALAAVAAHSRRPFVPEWLLSHPAAALGSVLLVMSLLSTSTLAPTLSLLSTALLLLYLVSRNGTGPAQVLDHPLLRGISLTSYSVFTWHLFGLDFDGLLGFLPAPIRVPTVVVITISMGAIMYLFLEWPARNLARRLRSSPFPWA